VQGISLHGVTVDKEDGIMNCILNVGAPQTGQVRATRYHRSGR